MISTLGDYQVASDIRVKLDLVDRRNDGAVSEETGQELDGAVGDTDGLQLVGVLLVEALHLLPGVCTRRERQ
jgi:hypothetical protein